MLYRVPVDPMQTLREVMVKFCGEHNLNADAQCFKHHRLGLVSMTTPFSLTGIETNAQLAVVPVTASASANASTLMHRA